MMLWGVLAIVTDECLRMLESLRRAMASADHSLKAFSIDADRDHGQIARAFKGEANLSLDMVARAPLAVRQHWHLREIARLGLPAEVEVALQIKPRMIRMNMIDPRRDKAAS